MISKGPLEADLKRLNRLYQSCVAGADRSLPIYYSKLGVLELTGWVEESFDIIANRAAKGRVKTPEFQKKVATAIKKTYGFEYDQHFLFMMAKIVGVPECEKLHAHFDRDGRVSTLAAQLDALVEQRRKAAHVNVARTAIRFDAPSVTLGRLKQIHPILREMYRWFC